MPASGACRPGLEVLEHDGRIAGRDVQRVDGVAHRADRLEEPVETCRGAEKDEQADE
jgi:hypothetical protein